MTDPVTGATVSPSRSMIRPVLALLAGLGVVAMISFIGVLIVTLANLRGVDPTNFRPTTGYLATSLAINGLGAFAGGFASSRITTGRSFYTVALLALLLLVSGVIPAIRQGPKPGEPDWYPLATALFVPMCVLLGGAFERRRTTSTSLA